MSCIIKTTEEETLDDGRVVKRYIYSLSKEGKDLMLKYNLNHHCCNYNGHVHTLKAEQKLFDLVGRDEVFDKKKSLEEAPEGIVALEDVIGEAEQKFKHEAVIELLRSEGKEISVDDFIYKKEHGYTGFVRCAEEEPYKNRTFFLIDYWKDYIYKEV